MLNVVLGSPARCRFGSLPCGLRLIGGLLLIGFLFLSTGCNLDSEKSEDVQEELPVLVEVVQPTRGQVLDSITLSGDLEAVNRVDVTSMAAGIVQKVYVREGQTVRAGELLLELEDSELELTAKEQELAFKDAQERVQSSLLAQEEAAHTITVKKLALDKATGEHERLQAVIASSSTNPLSLEEMEAKSFAMRSAKIEHKSAIIAHSRQIHQASLDRLSVEKAKAAWDRAKLNLDRMKIRSPLDGVISFLQVRPGELAKNAELVCSIVNLRALYSELRVPQRRLSSISIGQIVKIRAESLPGIVFTGRLDTINPTIDPTQGTVKVRVSVQDPTLVLRPGIYISATIELELRNNVLLIPKRARLFERDRGIVYMVQDGVARRVLLTEALQTATHLEIPQGNDLIDDQSKIVVRGQSQLQDGTKVEIQATQVELSAPDEAAGAVDKSGQRSEGQG